MSKKTRTPQSPEEKKAYWLKRLVGKANSVFPQFQRDVNEIAEMGKHAGMTPEELAGVRSMIIDQVLKATNKLVPAKPYDPTSKGKDATTKK